MVEGQSSRLSVIVSLLVIYLRGVLQMDSKKPKAVLVRWKTYGFERYSLPRGIWDKLLSGQSRR